MHDASKVLLGTTDSSDREVSMFDSDPASFPAGTAVRVASTGALSTAKSAGFAAGLSLGKSLSDTKKTAVLRAGGRVPLRLAFKGATGNATITSYANLVSGTADSITIGATVFTAQAGAATPGAATFQAATSNNATATSLAAQINAHATAGALVTAVASSAVVNLYAKASGAAGNSVALAYTNGDANVGATVSGAALAGGSDTIGDVAFVTVGAKAYINDVTGLGDLAALGTVSDATYLTGVLSGVTEDGTLVPCALVDMRGGL